MTLGRPSTARRSSSSRLREVDRAGRARRRAVRDPNAASRMRRGGGGAGGPQRQAAPAAAGWGAAARPGGQWYLHFRPTKCGTCRARLAHIGPHARRLQLVDHFMLCAQRYLFVAVVSDVCNTSSSAPAPSLVQK